MAALNSDQKLKLMIMKMLKERGSPSVRDMEAEGLDDVEIPPEHEEVLSGLAKLFGCADKDFLTLADLREFEILLEKKGVVDKGGLLKKGGILEDVELSDRHNMTEEQIKKAKRFSLQEHLRPAAQKLNEEASARKKAIAIGKMVKEKEGKSLTISLTKKAKEPKSKLVDGEESQVEKSVEEKQGKGNGDGSNASQKRETSKAAVATTLPPFRVDAVAELARVMKEKGISPEALASRLFGGKLARDGIPTALSSVLPTKNEAERREEEYNRAEGVKDRALRVTVTTRSKAKKPDKDKALVKTQEARKDGRKGFDFGDRMPTFREILYTSESVNERPGPDGEGPPAVTYKIVLKCITRGTTEMKVLELWEVPKTGVVLKDRIERQFQIPTSFQHDLQYAGKVIEEDTALSSVGLKPRGKLELSYLCEGELEDVRVSVKFYQFLLRFGKKAHPSIFVGMPGEQYMLCTRGLSERLPNVLHEDLFVPWDSNVKYANRVYFIQKNGIEYLVDVYEMLIMESWRTMVLPLKLLEADVILTLATLGCSTVNRNKVLTADGHGFVLLSLLRVLIHPRGVALVDTSRAPGPAPNNNFLLKELLSAVVQFFVNYRECQEVHIDICSKNNAVDQMISIVHCPSFSVRQAQDCLCVLACSMHSLDTHKWLCRNHTLESIADSVRIHRERGEANSKEIALLHYYAQVTLAHLVTTSVHVMSKKVTEKLVLFMEEFLSVTSPSTIQELERERHPRTGSWTPFFPYLKVLLSPARISSDLKTHTVNRSESATIARVMELSVETMLFVVQVMATGHPYQARRQLLEEKALSYALCLSANVPQRLVSRARCVVAALRSDSSKPVPVPKLNIMARAKLAAVHFGLKKAMDRSAEELKLEVSPPPPRPTPSARPSVKDVFYMFSGCM